MVYITLANLKRIVYASALKDAAFSGQVYEIPIYFFSRYETNALLAIKELLENPEHYFNSMYKPYRRQDTFTYVYEGGKPAYHLSSECGQLHADYRNYEVPEVIREKGPEAVMEFRNWFKTVEHLLEQPDAFVMRLHAKYGIVTNPQALIVDNSGSTALENITIEDLQPKINKHIKEAGRFFYSTPKNQAILSRFSKLTFLANKTEPIENNDTGYSDDEVKELLREYDKTFKKPLKLMLIEYYKLKFNPDIKMEGRLLDVLGFRCCLACKNDPFGAPISTAESSDLPF